MRKGIIVKSAALATTLLVTAGCGGKGDKQAQNAVPEETKKTLVRTARAAVRPVEQNAEFTGTIQPFTQNNISPATGMRIDKIYVEVGDRVRKGQLLVEMDKSQYLQSAVQLENLKADLARYETLYREGGISKQQLDQTRTQVSVAQHVYDNLKENTELISPVNGIVTERVYDPGDIYSASQGRILTVMQIDKVKVQVNVSESYFPKVKEGMPVDIRLDLYPDRVFKGKVSLIYPAIDPATRTFTTGITIPNGDLTLRPGMFSRVSLNFGTADHVVVPDIAIQKQIGSNERYVFVVKDGRAERRTVTTGRVVGTDYEILSGINDGEEVVVAGAAKLLDQTEVEITDK